MHFFTHKRRLLRLESSLAIPIIHTFVRAFASISEAHQKNIDRSTHENFCKTNQAKFDDMKYRSKLVFLCILVSFLPLSVMGFFCYNQTIKLLRARELSSLESTITSVSDSLDSKISIYQNLLSYLANSNVLAQFSSYNDANAYDQYEYLNYTMDVFLKCHLFAAS